MLLGGDLGFLARVVAAAFVVLFGPVVGFVVRRKWRRSVARKEEIKRLLVLASEETARAELEASSEYVYVGHSYGSTVEVEAKPAKVEIDVEVPVEVEIRSQVQAPAPSPGPETAKAPRKLQYQCAVCSSPTTTRCKQCKAVHYCSGKCQIFHWRQGHKDECQPFAFTDQNNDMGDIFNLNPLRQKENGSYTRTVDIEGGHPAKPVETSSREFAFPDSNLPKSLSGKGDIEVDHLKDEKEPNINLKFATHSISDELSGLTSLSKSAVDSSANDMNNFHISDKHDSDCGVPNKIKTDRPYADQTKPRFSDQAGSVNSADKVATSFKHNLSKPSTLDGDSRFESSSSSGSSVDGCDESSFSEPSTPSSGFWDGTINSSRTQSDALDDTAHSCSNEAVYDDVLDSQFSLCCSSELTEKFLPRVNVQGSHVKKVFSEDLHPSLSEIRKSTSGLASSKKMDESQRSSTNSEKSGHADVTDISKKVSRSRESSVPAIGKDAKASSLPSSNPEKLKCQIAAKSRISQEPKSMEARILSSKSSDAHLYSTTSKLAVENAKSVKINSLDEPPTDSSDSLCHSQNAKSSSKASVWKVVDQLKTSKLARLNPLGVASESVGRYNNKGLFPYEVFVKLYNWNKVELHPRGLLNCGNSCYANVVLQCLAFTPPLTAYFLQGLHSKACKKRDWCFTCEFECLVLKAKEGYSPISPSRIISQIQNIGSNLGNGREEDAHEFLRYAIDTMQSICLKEVGFSASGSLEEETTMMGLTFGGYLRSKIECMRCGGKSERHEKMMDLTVEIEGDIGTLEEALRQFTHTETLDGENKYKCSRCKSYEKARKKLRVLEAPNVLTIALKRFQSGKFGKLNKTIKFPEILDLAPYMSGTSDKSPIYRLYGVVVHLDIMNAAFSGHYVCYVKNTQNKWFKIDDSTVKAVELARVLTKGAYMLLYARCSPRAPRSIRSLLSDPRTAKDIGCKPNRSRVQWDVSLSDLSNSQNSNEFLCPSRASFHPIQTILEEDSSSDHSSSFFSEVNSCSTESSNRDSVSTDDYFDQIFGDVGVWNWRNSSDSETSSSSSSPSPMYLKHTPITDLDHYTARYSETSVSWADATESDVNGRQRHHHGSSEEDAVECNGSIPFSCSDSTKICRKLGSSSSCRETGSSKLGWVNPFDNLRSSVKFRRSMRE